VKRNRYSSPLLIIALLSLTACVSSSVQDFPKPKKPFNYSLLSDAVLNTLFPSEPPDLSFNVFLTLRSFSSVRYENESQINIFQDDSGHFHVVQYYTPSGSDSIGEQFAHLYEDDKLSPDDDTVELAKRFKVDVRAVDIPDETLLGLLNELNEFRFQAIHLDPPKKQSPIRNIMLDGFWYEVSYETAQGKLHFSLNNPKHQQGNVQDFGKWIDRLESLTNSAPALDTGRPRSGLILGFVYDAEFADIPGASVTVSEKKTNTRIASLKSDERGEFLVPDLQPGVYTVAVESDSPRIRFVQDVTVIPARQASVSVRADGRVTH
jgi:hypothetical protein